MKASKKKMLHRMEMEDDQGISRVKKPRLMLSIKQYRIVKLCLIAAIPVAYFIYSPLLIFIMLCYFALYFVTKRTEKYMNRGLRRDLRTFLPKFDSVLALIVVIITCASVCVSTFTTKQLTSMFNGMNAEQVEDMASRHDFSGVNTTFLKVKSKLQDLCTMLTGERVFFTSTQRFGKNGAKPSDFNGEPPEGFDGEAPEGEPPTDFGGGSKPDISEFMGQIPFSMIFQSVLKAVNTVLIFIVAACGLLALF